MSFQAVSTIGQQVARYRKAAKMSGEELADKAGAGLTRSVIANLENGRKDDVTVRQLIALANALGVPPVCLVVDIFEPSSPSPYEMPTYTAEVFDVNKLAKVPFKSRQRTADFYHWFGARHLYAEPLSSSQKMVYDALNALGGYDSAWGEFSRALQAYVDFMESPKPNTEVGWTGEEDFLSGRLKNAAENTIRWARVLGSNGIQNKTIIGTVEKAMARVNVAFDIDADG